MGNGKNLNGLHKNGHEFPVEVSLSHINIENHTLAIAIVVDVTEQRKLMDEISLSKTLYSSLVENTIDHIFQLDKNLTIKYINHVSPGLTKEQVIGSNLLDLLPERKYKVLAQKTINRVFDTGIAESYEIVYPSPFGPLNYTTSVSPVIKNGEIIRVNLI